MVDKLSQQRWPSAGTAAGHIRTTDSRFVKAEITSPEAVRLVGSTGSAVVLELVDHGRTLEVRYEPVEDNAIRVLDDLLCITEADGGYVIVPCREGLLIPVDGKPFKKMFGTSDYEGCHMNMLGFLKAGSGLIASWDNAYVFPEVERRSSTAGGVGPKLSTTFELRRSARSVWLTPTGSGDWNTVAAEYRRLAEKRGYAVTLREKIEREPRAELLVGASNFKLWHALIRRMDENSTEVKWTRVRWTFDEAARIAEHLRNELDIDRCLFIIGGWVNGGYDCRHPDILPANPECGGNDGLANALKRIDKLGYVSSLHDNYQDMYRNAPSYDSRFTEKRADGSLRRGGYWFGGVPDIVCTPKQLELARRPQNLPAVRDLFAPGCYFIDTTFAVDPQECYDPDHPVDRNSDIEWKKRLVDYARDMFGMFGSECGREWAIPHSDVFEGITSVYGRYFHDDSLNKLDATVIPFWEMVYHDCQICYGKYSCRPEAANESIAQHVLCARPFFYHFNEEYPDHLYWQSPPASPGTAWGEDDRESWRFTSEICSFSRSDSGWAEGMDPLDVLIKNTHEVLGPVHRVTAYERLTRMEFLTSDRSARKAVYGQGENATTIIVNFGSEDAQVQSELGGDVVLPQWGFTVDSPCFAAFYARRWNGRDYGNGSLFTLRPVDERTLQNTRRLRIFHGFGPADITLNGRHYTVAKEQIVELHSNQRTRS